MQKCCYWLLNVVCVWFLASCAHHAAPIASMTVDALPTLPHGVSNNAVAAVKRATGTYLISFNGLGEGREWHDTLTSTQVLAPDAASWTMAADVPGEHGRLASVAVSVGEYGYVFGGYTVAEDHSEVSLPLVHRFDPVAGSFRRLADMPVPVDDAMALVYQERYVYLISGWHDSANVNLVQMYDTVTDNWKQATAYPGAPVFGHAGGMVSETMVVCGGVKIQTFESGPRAFDMNPECYRGVVRADNPRRIDWQVIDPMPGEARYRMAAVGSIRLGGVVFVGGSDNPYNYNGIGYNGKPSEPLRSMWMFNTDSGLWNWLGDQPAATMDHRGLLPVGAGFITVGGMTAEQVVSPRVIRYQFDLLKK